MDAEESAFRKEAIAELMARDELTVSDFARRASTARALVAAWLSGHVTPQIGTIGRLCRVFDVDLLFFFNTEDRPGVADAQPPATQGQPKTGRKRK